MIEKYTLLNRYLQEKFRVIEDSVPKPLKFSTGENSSVFRYADAGRVEIAIFQKFARYLSGLESALVLLQNGFTQEVGVIFRTLDEFYEDIDFLCIPLYDDQECSSLHREFLDYFFQEEFDNPNSAFLSTQKRGMVRRDRITSAITNRDDAKKALNPSDAKELVRTLQKAYGGFVHGASCHINEMISLTTRRYFLGGMQGTPQHDGFMYTYWDYCYRGLICSERVAWVFGEQDLEKEIKEFRRVFQAGDEGRGVGDVEKLLRKMKLKEK